MTLLIMIDVRCWVTRTSAAACLDKLPNQDEAPINKGTGEVKERDQKITSFSDPQTNISVTHQTCSPNHRYGCNHTGCVQTPNQPPATAYRKYSKATP